jgi:CheY-like chemotaxis protein
MQTQAGAPRVLVIDDEPSILTAISRVLAGMDVTLARGGREGLRLLLDQRNYDVILCDVTMPDVSGIEVYETTREVAPELAQRTVFMSGGSISPATQEFLRTTTQPRIDKPFNASALREMVARVATVA